MGKKKTHDLQNQNKYKLQLSGKKITKIKKKTEAFLKKHTSKQTHTYIGVVHWYLISPVVILIRPLSHMDLS